MYRLIVAALIVIAASIYAVQMLEEKQQAGLTAPPPRQERLRPATGKSRSVVLKAVGGHFAADARVDGRPVAFMVDTGASQIALRESEAARLGYRPRSSDYTVRIQTANGEGRAALVELRRVEIGDIMVRDIRAVVVPDAALTVNLLGMSFLRHVRFTSERGRMVLEQ